MNRKLVLNEIDMSLIIKNIRTIAKEKKYKIGELEKDAGLSIGYLARLENKDNSVKPSIEIIYKISQLLEENIDLIVNYDFEYINKDGKYLYNCFDKLINLTAKNKIRWEYQDNQFIINDNENTNPIYTYEPRNFEIDIYFKSHFSGAIDVEQLDMLITKLNGIHYYLVSYIDKKKKSNIYEFYSVKNEKLLKIFYTTENSNIILYDKMEELYDLARKTSQYVYLDENMIDDLNNIFKL